MTRLFAKQTMAMTALGSAALALSAAPAQAQSGAITFVDLGRWTVLEYTGAGYCEMRLQGGLNGELVVRKSAGRPGSLRIALDNANRFGGNVIFAFDDVQFGGSSMDGRTFAPSMDSSAIDAEFRKAERLSVIQGGATLASISLKSSAAGYRLLDQCADQWREGFFPPRQFRSAQSQAQPPATTQVPAAPPSRATRQPSRRQPAQQPPAQARRGPYEPNRAVAPRNANNWIRPGDFRSLPELRGDGVLMFSLSVSARGEVEECSVLKSTGSRDLDRTTCRLLQQRARFEPASDANGFATRSTYTSQVEFAPGE